MSEKSDSASGWDVSPPEEDSRWASIPLLDGLSDKQKEEVRQIVREELAAQRPTSLALTKNV
jgi:hypothetical protein